MTTFSMACEREKVLMSFKYIYLFAVKRPKRREDIPYISRLVTYG